MSNLVERLRDWEHVHPEDYNKPAGHLYEVAADRIEELQSRLRWVITERDDTFVRMLRRAETAEAVLKKLEYWFDADQEVLDAMTPDERADHMRQLTLIRDTLTS